MQPTTEDAKPGVVEHVTELRHAVTEHTRAILDTLYSYVDEKPIASVAFAFGVGYVLSGALLSRATIRAIRLGARAAMAGALKHLLGSHAGAGVVSPQ
jgi:hypothetical protein